MLNNLGWLEGTPFGTMSAGCDGTTNRCHAYLPPSPLLADQTSTHFAAAQKIAEESAVLLKNDGSLLPLTAANWSGGNRVVVMGTSAFQNYTGGGGSAQVIPIAGQVPPAYDSLVAAAPPGANITYALGNAGNAAYEGFVVPSQGGSAAHAASAAYPTSGIDAGSGFLREQTTFAVTPAGSAATHCTVGDPGRAPRTRPTHHRIQREQHGPDPARRYGMALDRCRHRPRGQRPVGTPRLLRLHRRGRHCIDRGLPDRCHRGR